MDIEDAIDLATAFIRRNGYDSPAYHASRSHETNARDWSVWFGRWHSDEQTFPIGFLKVAIDPSGRAVWEVPPDYDPVEDARRLGERPLVLKRIERQAREIANANAEFAKLPIFPLDIHFAIRRVRELLRSDKLEKLEGSPILSVEYSRKTHELVRRRWVVTFKYPNPANSLDLPSYFHAIVDIKTGLAHFQ